MRTSQASKNFSKKGLDLEARKPYILFHPMNIVIIAPHADDEIIGCFRVLENVPANSRVFVVMDKSDQTVVPYASSSTPFSSVNNIELIRLIESHSNLLLFMFSLDKTHFFFPDPFTECHPAHKAWGMLGYTMALRHGATVIYYTTTMMTPYTKLLSREEQKRKKKMLDTLYPGKKSMWKYEHKYFMFEGLAYYF